MCKWHHALHLALMLAGVKREDEVITQALTFVATCNAISYIGAQPIFIDVDSDTMGLSPAAVDKWLNGNAEVREDCYNKNTGRGSDVVYRCIPSGTPFISTNLQRFAGSGIWSWLRDAAESLGSFYKGRHTGTFGRVGILVQR